MPITLMKTERVNGRKNPSPVTGLEPVNLDESQYLTRSWYVDMIGHGFVVFLL